MTDRKYVAKIVKKRFEEIREELTRDTPDRINAMMAPEMVEFDVEKMTSRIRFEKHEWEKNQRGELHGGAISAMFDVSMGMSICAFDGGDVTTADISVSFIRPFTGESFLMDVEIAHPGRSLVRVRAKAFDEESGKLLASATGNFVRLR